MLTVDHYELIRRKVLIEGLSQRQTAKELGHSRTTVAKALAERLPPGYRLSGPRPRPVLEPVKPIIDARLEQNTQTRPKQRQTARRMYERLCDEYGFTGHYGTVQRYVKQASHRQKEAFMPLQFDPGEEAQVDWHEGWIVENGIERKCQFFVMKLCYSKATFVYRWWVYPEAGSYWAEAEIEGSQAVQAKVHVPREAAGRTIHVILEVTDQGEPPLTAYRRVILEVSGERVEAPPGAEQFGRVVEPVTELDGPPERLGKWRFYRGININGETIEIDGHRWTGDDTKHFVCDETAVNSPQVPLWPPTDENRAKMIHSFRWDRKVEIEVREVPDGRYAVYAYVWEDNNAEQFSISLHHQQPPPERARRGHRDSQRVPLSRGRQGHLFRGEIGAAGAG